VVTRDAGGETRIESIRGEGEIHGSVRVASGPWKIEEGGWKAAPEAREYWDVEMEKGTMYRVFHGSDTWFVDALLA